MHTCEIAFFCKVRSLRLEISVDMFQNIFNVFKNIFKSDKAMIFLSIAIAIVLIGGSLVITKFGFNFGSGKSAEALAKDSIDFLNQKVLQGQKATLIGYSKESGVIKVTLEIEGNKFDSYITKDGKLFFPEAISTDSPIPQ